jgi:hypothetical protein
LAGKGLHDIFHIALALQTRQEAAREKGLMKIMKIVRKCATPAWRGGLWHGTCTALP